MSNLLGAVLLSLFLLFIPSDASYYQRTVTYKRDVILRCYNTDSPMIQTVINFPGIDVWTRNTEYVDMRMSRQRARVVRDYLPHQCHVLVSNVEYHVKKAERDMFTREQRIQNRKFNNGWDVAMQSTDDPTAEDWHTKYHNYESIIDWYHHLAKTHPNLVTVQKIGKTYEKRDLIGVRITAANKASKAHHRVYMQCLIHAREWISGAVCMYQADMLVKKHESSPHLLNSMEFVIVPVVNPDGYVYTWNRNRLWRKNRVYDPIPTCRGVDLNRNFNAGWGKIEPSTSAQCGETYHGRYAASELEVQHVKKFFKENGPIVAAVDFHSYGQLILRPYGYIKDGSKDEETYKSIATEMKKFLPEYTSERSSDLYIATGVASDWFYSDEAMENNYGKRPISFTIELRDKGKNGFLLPADQILPTAKEARKALLSLASNAHKTPLIE